MESGKSRASFGGPGENTRINGLLTCGPNGMLLHCRPSAPTDARIDRSKEERWRETNAHSNSARQSTHKKSLSGHGVRRGTKQTTFCLQPSCSSAGRGGRKEGCDALHSPVSSAPLPIHAIPPLPPPLVPPLQNTYVELGGGGSETVELPAHRDQIGTFLITLREVQSTPIN